jgi:hypothetical protein
VSTGAMTGADAPALRALATQMSQSAARLDAIRQGIRSRLYSIQWGGPDGADFRRAWDGRHVPMLAHVAEGLRHSAERLLAEADQQEAASGVGGGVGGGGGGQTSGPSTGRVDPRGNEFPENPLDPVEGVIGGLAAFTTLMRANLADRVSGYMRANGTYVDAYWRWSAGHASRLNGMFGSADDMASASRHLSRAGNALSVVGFGFDAGEQWTNDEGKGYGTGERATRAGFAAAAPIAAERTAMWAGAAIGTAIFPGVGTVIGGAVGWLAVTVLSEVFEDELAAAGAAVGSVVWNTGEAVVDFGGDVLEAGGDLLGDIGDGAADLWEDLTPW